MRRTLFVLSLPALIAACENPGEGKKAATGYRFCEPIISELDAYKLRYQTYPDSLEQLSIDSVRRGLVPEGLRDMSYYPDSAKASYQLQFSYEGPGMNQCTYGSETKGWNCRGYY